MLLLFPFFVIACVILLQIINSSEEIESFVVDPVKTLNSLKRAAECHCVFEKVPLHNDYDTDDYERKKTADRLLLF